MLSHSSWLPLQSRCRSEGLEESWATDQSAVQSPRSLVLTSLEDDNRRENISSRVMGLSERCRGKQVATKDVPFVTFPYLEQQQKTPSALRVNIRNSVSVVREESFTAVPRGLSLSWEPEGVTFRLTEMFFLYSPPKYHACIEYDQFSPISLHTNIYSPMLYENFSLNAVSRYAMVVAFVNSRLLWLYAQICIKSSSQNLTWGRDGLTMFCP